MENLSQIIISRSSQNICLFKKSKTQTFWKSFLHQTESKIINWCIPPHTHWSWQGRNNNNGMEKMWFFTSFFFHDAPSALLGDVGRNTMAGNNFCLSFYTWSHTWTCLLVSTTPQEWKEQTWCVKVLRLLLHCRPSILK